MEKISIIIPAYNEEKRIGKTLEEYGKFFAGLKSKKNIDSEILIVINNTKDRTEEIVKKCRKKYKIIKYLNFKRGGKGFAIIEGFKDALKRKDNTLIGFVDADLATSPDAFYDLAKNINNFDGIIASRYLKNSIVMPKQPFSRIIASRVFNTIVRALFLFPYRDTQCGAKIFKRKAIEKILPRLGVTEWAFDVDLLYQSHRLGLKVKEHPTVWQDKEGSKINLKRSSTQMFLAVARLRVVSLRFGRIFIPLRGLIKPIYNLVK